MNQIRLERAEFLDRALSTTKDAERITIQTLIQGKGDVTALEKDELDSVWLSGPP